MPFSTWHPASKIFTNLHKSSQILHRSFKDLSKISQNLPSSIPFHLVPGQSVIPAHSPVLYRSPQIFTDLHGSILPFSLYLSIIYSIFRLQDLHRSSTDLSKIFQNSPFLHPLSLGTWTVGHSGPLFRSPSLPSLLLSLRFITGLLQIFQNFYSPFIPCFLVSGQSVIPAHSPDLQAFRFPPFTYISWLILHRSSKILPPLSPSTSYLDSRSFRPTLQIFFISISYTLLSGRSVILPVFPRWRIHTKFPIRLP